MLPVTGALPSEGDGGSADLIQCSEPVEFGLMRRGEASKVSAMIVRAFHEDVAPDCDVQGVEAFERYAHPKALLKRSEHGHLVLVARVQASIVGAIELREHQHISLLFVDRQHRRRGLARELLSRALSMGRSGGHHVVEVTVNSSPYAVPAYEKLGFRATGPAQTKSGIRFAPMVLTLDNER